MSTLHPVPLAMLAQSAHRRCQHTERSYRWGIEIIYVYHAVQTRSRSWAEVSNVFQNSASQYLQAQGGKLYGIFRNQIGRPRDELSVITAWPQERQTHDENSFFACVGNDLLSVDSRPMRPTIQPDDFLPPTRQGNFAFCWFETPPANYDDFIALCEAAWPGFESSYDSQVLGLWRLEESQGSTSNTVKTLSLTRRPDLAMWERSKIPLGVAEEKVREQLSRRYELCDATWVFTTTLLTARDHADEVKWA
jgi:hypothetical protein